MDFPNKKSIVLLSGGLDSAVCLGMYRDTAVLALGFEYGQTHNVELGYAEGIAKRFGVPFELMRIRNLRKTDDVIYSARNMLMIAHAVARAQEIGADSVIIGCNLDDQPRFPDCTHLFMAQMSGAAKFGYNVNVIAPLLNKPKSTVAKLARKLKIDPESTWSCYTPANGKPCNECLACQVRKRAMA